MDGPGIAAIGVGTIFLYGSIKGYSPVKAFQNIITGKNPNEGQSNTATLTSALPSSGSNGSSGSGGTIVNGGNAKATLQQTAAQFGWGSGAQWTALDAIEMEEAGYNTMAKNPSSGAFGMAQSLGHPFSGGPAPNGVNEYGGQGLTPAQSRAASMGDAGAQSLWMCRYIKGRYTNPVNAQAYHLAHNSY
jgi:resuscitation-promoting factor RpfB